MTAYTPAGDDFAPLTEQRDGERLDRPSLSYWQDVWRRLRSKRSGWRRGHEFPRFFPRLVRKQRERLSRRGVILVLPRELHQAERQEAEMLHK